MLPLSREYQRKKDMDDGACVEVVGHEGMEQPTFLLIFGTGDVPL